MTSRRKRAVLVLLGLLGLGISASLVLKAFEQNLVFFFTPTQVMSGAAPSARSIRVGGLVETGSVQRQADGVTVQFVVTDQVRRLPVQYRGSLPDLFKEGKGVVAQGRLSDEGRFVADEVLAKHDENYMPPEAAQALKQAAAAPQGAAPLSGTSVEVAR